MPGDEQKTSDFTEQHGGPLVVYPCMQGGSQSPQLLARGDTSSQGYGSTPVDGADHFTSIHEYTCAYIQSWPGLPWSCSSHTYADGTYSQGPHRHYSLSSSWLGVFWSPVANCTLASPLETPLASRPFSPTCRLCLVSWSVLVLTQWLTHPCKLH